MFARYLLIAAVMFTVSGCSKDDQAAMDQQGLVGQEQTMQTGGPLSDVYGTNVAPGTQEDLAQNVGDRVFFGYDRFDVSDEAQMTLDKQAEWLQQYSNLSITIEGHADERGTREYNLALGDRRANAVKNYLVAKGSDEAAWAQNRRGVTVVQ
jgi:peptidoglycan-associated lipoprotein